MLVNYFSSHFSLKTVLGTKICKSLSRTWDLWKCFLDLELSAKANFNSGRYITSKITVVLISSLTGDLSEWYFSFWSPTPVTTETWYLHHQYWRAIVLIFSHLLLCQYYLPNLCCIFTPLCIICWCWVPNHLQAQRSSRAAKIPVANCVHKLFVWAQLGITLVWHMPTWNTCST